MHACVCVCMHACVCVCVCVCVRERERGDKGRLCAGLTSCSRHSALASGSD